MVRRILRDSVIYSGSALFSQAIAFALFPFLAHTLATTQYGVIDIVSVLTSLVLLTVALEISQGLARMVGTTTDADARSTYASTALIWSIACYTVFAALALAFAGPLTHAVLGAHVDVWITRVAIGGIWFAGALYVVQDQLRWHMRPQANALVTAVVAVATTGATAVYVFVLGGRALGVVAGQLTGALVGLVVGLALSRDIYRLRFDREKARVMLAFSIPLVPSSVGVLLNGYADRLAIQHEQSLAAVGVYGIAFRISLVVSLLIVGVQAAAMPHVLSRHSEAGTPREVARAFRLFWLAGCLVFVVLGAVAEPLVRLLAARAYFAGAHVVPFLVAATFLGGSYVFAPGPAVSGRTRAFAGCNVAGGLVNLGLAFALVNAYGVIGAGIATVVSSAIVFVSTMAVSQRLYPVPHDWLRVGLAAGVAAAAVSIGRSLVVMHRAEALQVAPVLERLAIAAAGGLLVAALLLDRGELRLFSLRPVPHRERIS